MTSMGDRVDRVVGGVFISGVQSRGSSRWWGVGCLEGNEMIKIRVNTTQKRSIFLARAFGTRREYMYDLYAPLRCEKAQPRENVWNLLRTGSGSLLTFRGSRGVCQNPRKSPYDRLRNIVSSEHLLLK